MKKLTNILSIGIILLMPFFSSAQKNSPELVYDFLKVEGSWKGTLTYLDYSSGKPYTMSADIEIKRIGESNQFLFIHTYPKEKSANSTETISISDNGKYIDKENVISRTKLSDGNIQIITERVGKDGNESKEATIRQTYTLGTILFSVRKDVRFLGEKNEWIKRHEYIYSK